MKWKEITRLTFKRLVFVFVIITFASILRIWPFDILENKVVWLTFYPTIMIIALYSGFFGGILAIILADFIVLFGWKLLVSVPFIQNSADWLGLFVFSSTCIFISVIAEMMRQSENRAVVLREKAQSANESKTLFLANMSHELRTPLNAILGYSQMLLNDESLNISTLKDVKVIHDSGNHLLSLINNILDVVKIESQKSTLQIGEFDFHELVSDIEKMFKLQVATKGLDFSINGLDDVPKWVFGDELKIKVVLMNLIGNSIKFTNDGTVTVSFSIENSKSDDRFQLIVEVEDTGVGISEAERDKLFQFFSQTSSGEFSKTGTGLGLAISQEYVRLMGGEIEVESVVAKGSKFSFQLNLQKSFSHDHVMEDVAKKVIGVSGIENVPTVLIADDSPVNRELLRKVLEEVGIIIISASNGLEAIEQYNKYNPDIIFMDIRMPILDGIEATKQILSLENFKPPIIIAVSAHVFENEINNILQNGFDDFIEKPFRIDDIYNMIKKHLNLNLVYLENIEVTQKDIEKDLPVEINIDEISKERLLEAVVGLDTKKINQIITEISISNPQAGIALRKLADELNFQEIWTRLKGE